MVPGGAVILPSKYGLKFALKGRLTLTENQPFLKIGNSATPLEQYTSFCRVVVTFVSHLKALRVELNMKPSFGVSYFLINTVMLLEHGICDISPVLVLARNSVYLAHSVEDTIPHVYRMAGHRSFCENPLILSS